MSQNPIFWGVLFFAVLVGYFLRQFFNQRQQDSLEQKIKKGLDEAQKAAADLVFKAQEKSHQILEISRQEEKEIKATLNRVEERLLKKEDLLERQRQEINKQEKLIKEDVEKIKSAQEQITNDKEKLDQEFQKISGLTSQQAHEKLLAEVREKFKGDFAATAAKIIKERQEEIEKKTTEIILTAMQRLSRKYAIEATTSSFYLENEDIKGKIIGREGRNIKALERETGVEFIMDENPNSIIISSFDPFRREIARLALEKLIKDGRIQPAKIEEKVEEAKQEINKVIAQKGDDAARETGVYNLTPEIIQLLGRLYFRASYGQNVLAHSIECSYLAGMIAEELGLNIETARAGALLHDIGKAIDQEVGGTHVEVGRRILKKFNVSDEVIQAMEAHHEEYPFSTPESFVVAAADALSASRPGARRDTIENYLKRLEELEKVVKEFGGVKNAYALSAGREIRIFVEPEKIDDFKMLELARDIADKIEKNLKYPGEIKVNIIRETRAVEYAK